MGYQVVALLTLNGIAIACDTSPIQTGENNINVFRLTPKVAVAVHDSLEVGSRFVNRLREADPPDNLDDILPMALQLFNTFVTETENSQHTLGVILAGYNSQGKSALAGFRYDGPQTRLPVSLRSFYPYVISTFPSSLYDYLLGRIFSPDMMIEEALELAAFFDNSVQNYFPIRSF